MQGKWTVTPDWCFQQSLNHVVCHPVKWHWPSALLSPCDWQYCTAWGCCQETSLLGILWHWWWLSLRFFDWHCSCSCSWTTSFSPLCLVSSILNVFQLEAALCPSHNAHWGYQSTPLCSDLRNVAETLPVKSICAEKECPLVILSVSLRRPFISFTFHWTTTNDVISFSPMTHPLLIQFRYLTNWHPLMGFIKGSLLDHLCGRYLN